MAGDLDPALAAQLERAAFYGLSGEVRRIDTHTAAVFLVGDSAFKIKKPVRFPYLDFSDRAARSRVCHDEVRINQRTAPSLYLGLRPVLRDDGGYSLGSRHSAGAEDPPALVDWMVEMARFDPDLVLSELIERAPDALERRHWWALADEIANLHAAAEADHSFDAAAEQAEIAAGSLAELGQSPALFPPDRLTALGETLSAAIAAQTALMQQRQRAGLVQRGHGDLHLRNIVLLEDRPTLFDALEFDPDLATGDVLYDIAFLLMDLGLRDQRRAANLVFNRYLERREDYGGLSLLPLFLAQRALIAAKIAAVQGETRRARAAFAFAEQSLAPPPPRLLMVGGTSGTGKSTLAGALAPDLAPPPGAVWLRSDVTRKVMLGRAPEETLPASAYQGKVSGRVRDILAERAGLALDAGFAVIVDAVFGTRDWRDTVASAAAGRPRRGLWLSAPLDTRLSRVGARSGDASDADADVARAQRVDPPAADEPWMEITSAGTIDETVKQAKHGLTDLLD